MRSFKIGFMVIGVMILLGVTILKAQTTPVVNAPSYAAQGAFSVGRAWFKLGKETKQPLVVIVWYPALKPTGGDQADALSVPVEYQTPNPEDIIEINNLGTSALNAAVDNSKAPYPLVIFSPNFGEMPFHYTSLEENLASHGFVVMSVLTAERELWSHYIARPTFTPREIDFAEQLNTQDGSFKGLIDTKHTGVVGVSSGGYTALASAGAQFNFTWFETWCVDHKTPAAMIACPDLLGHKEDMLALAKLGSMPTGLWPGWGDSRVSAIVSQTGEAYLFGPEGLSSVTVPVMVQVGSNENSNTPEWSAYLTYDNVASIQKAQVVFEGGTDIIFGNWGGAWTSDSTHDLIRHFTTAFLLFTLKNDQEAHKALLSGNVTFTGIDYKTTMK